MKQEAQFDLSAFGNRLTQAIEDSGQSVPKLADQCGFTHKTIYDWQQGTVPRLLALQTLAGVLGVGLDYLLFGESAATPPDVASVNASAELRQLRQDIGTVASQLTALASPD